MTAALALAIGPCSLAQCPAGWITSFGANGPGFYVQALANWDPDGPGPLATRPVAGGYFIGVRQFDPSASTWPGLGTIEGIVDRLNALPDGTLLASGWLNLQNGYLHGTYAYNPITSSWSVWSAGVPEGVAVVRARDQSAYFVGGAFTSAGGVPATNIALNAAGVWTALGQGLDAAVSAMAIAPNGDLFVGGSFRTAGTVALASIGRWDGNQWHALGSGLARADGEAIRVYDLCRIPDGGVIVSGDFHIAGGIQANGIAKWDGQTWSAFGNVAMRSIAVLSTGRIVGIPANTVARSSMVWDGSAWTTVAENQSNGVMYSVIAVDGGDFAVGGNFSQIDYGVFGGTPALSAARFTFGGAPPMISSQPMSDRSCRRSPVLMQTSYESDRTCTVRWQMESALNSEVWADLANGPTSVNLTFENVTTTQLTARPINGASIRVRVRCIVTNVCGMTISEAATVTSCPPDFDCSGSVAFQDIFAFLNAWFSGSMDADFLADGVLGTVDIFVFLNAWFRGC